jgi:hypothetical protein
LGTLWEHFSFLVFFLNLCIAISVSFLTRILSFADLDRVFRGNAGGVSGTGECNGHPVVHFCLERLGDQDMPGSRSTSNQIDHRERVGQTKFRPNLETQFKTLSPLSDEHYKEMVRYQEVFAETPLSRNIALKGSIVPADLIEAN